MHTYEVGQRVCFTYHGTDREGVVETVYPDRITVCHDDRTYKSYMLIKMKNERVYYEGWMTAAG